MTEFMVKDTWLFHSVCGKKLHHVEKNSLGSTHGMSLLHLFNVGVRIFDHFGFEALWAMSIQTFKGCFIMRNFNKLHYIVQEKLNVVL